MHLGTLGGLTATLVLVSLSARAQDTTPPGPGLVVDGVGSDLDGQVADDTLQANWSGFQDPESPPVIFAVAVGTAPDCPNVAPFRTISSNTSYIWSVSGGTLRQRLTRGERYFVTVRATNSEGLSTRASSDGITVARDDGSYPAWDGGVPPCPEPSDGGVPDGGGGDGGGGDAGVPDAGLPPDDPPLDERGAPLGWGCGALGGEALLGVLVLGMLGLLRSPRRR